MGDRDWRLLKERREEVDINETVVVCGMSEPMKSDQPGVQTGNSPTAAAIAQVKTLATVSLLLSCAGNYHGQLLN